MTDAADQIQTPRRWTMDHFGPAAAATRVGDYLRSTTSGKVYLVLSARPVRVKVSRGETLRQRLEVIPWHGEVPEGVRLGEFEPYRRPRRAPRRLNG